MYLKISHLNSRKIYSFHNERKKLISLQNVNWIEPDNDTKFATLTLLLNRIESTLNLSWIMKLLFSRATFTIDEFCNISIVFFLFINMNSVTWLKLAWLYAGCQTIAACLLVFMWFSICWACRVRTRAVSVSMQVSLWSHSEDAQLWFGSLSDMFSEL